MKYPLTLKILIELFRQLPGVGKKSAERFAFSALDWPEDRLHRFSALLGSLKSDIQTCQCCGAIYDDASCYFCNNSTRDQSKLCVVSSAQDIFRIEATSAYRGLYHVTLGLISPIDNRTPRSLKLDNIAHRISQTPIEEVILALDSTIEGDATSLYLIDLLTPLNVKITRLALGLPMGSSLDFIDVTTLNQAFCSRTQIQNVLQ